MGIGVGKCVGVWGRKRRCGKRYERRCRKVCWDMGEVKADVRRGEVREEMWGSVLGPHTLIYFILSYTSPIPLPSLPSRQHTSPLTPCTFPHPSPHLSTPTHLSLLIPTHCPTPPPQLTSPYTPTHFPTDLMHSPQISPHSLDYVVKLPCDDVTLNNLIGVWKSPIKFFRQPGILSLVSV